MPEPKVVLITGASAGIGRAIAMLLARKGYWVFGTSRNPNQVRMVPGVMLLPLDVTSTTSIHACVREVLDRAGRIDALINNAGSIGPVVPSEEMDINEARHLFETNFFGVVQLTNAVLPTMREQGSGFIINISSAAGVFAGPPFFSLYAASKHALEGWSEGLRYEVDPLGIRVALVEPGYMRTGLENSMQPHLPEQPAYALPLAKSVALDRFALQYGGDPAEVAQTIANLLRERHPALRHTVGTDSSSMTLFYRLLPTAWFERFIRWIFLDWQPAHPITPEDKVTPQQVGIRQYLLDAKKNSLLLRVVLSGIITTVGLLLGWKLAGRKND